MYIRFESSVPDRDARCNQGVFCTAFDIWYDQPHLRHLWQVAEMRRLLDWFNEHLDAPERMYYRPNRKAELSGVCWFRSAAHACVDEGRYLAWLLCDLGHPIEEKRSTSPGRILWEDTNQIVATPLL